MATDEQHISMRYDQRIVSQTPLEELWDKNGPVTSKELRDLSVSDIKELLAAGRVQFVIADIGAPLEWLPADECFEFWRTQVKEHVANPEESHNPWEWPDGYFYFASEWDSPSGVPIVLLTVHH